MSRTIEAKANIEKSKIEEERQLARYQATMNNVKTNYIDVIIPTGYAPTKIEGENSVENGLVITDDIGNEYVWIEVPKGITFNCNNDEEIERNLKKYAMPYTKGANNQKYEWMDEWYAIENEKVITKDTERIDRKPKNVS